MTTKIDVWFGSGEGYSNRYDGILLSLDGDKAEIDIIDPFFLEDYKSDDDNSDTYIVSADKIKEDCYVPYDDFCWSYVGEVICENDRLSPKHN